MTNPLAAAISRGLYMIALAARNDLRESGIPTPNLNVALDVYGKQERGNAGTTDG